MKITIYTDGSSRGNPGPGGWGAILIIEYTGAMIDGGHMNKEDEVIELGGREDMTTNNRMELMGTIQALREIGGNVVEIIDDRQQSEENTFTIEICTDSQYVKKGMTEWIDGWIKNGWKSSTKKPVLNQDLWQALKHEEERLMRGGAKITWKYVQAHVGIPLNERADTIATGSALLASDLQLYRGPKKDYTV